MTPSFLYACVNEAPVYQTVINNKGYKIVNKIQLGTYVTIVDELDDFYKVTTAGPNGWMRKADLGKEMGLKVFFLDVGQGDGALIEIGDLKIIVDAGPGINMYSYLTKWQYTYLLRAKKPVHIDYLFISHFDRDHYKGFIKIINDKRFTFGSVFFPGIVKYAKKNNPYKTGLGQTIKSNGITYLQTKSDDLLSATGIAAYNRDINKLVEALKNAKAEGRLKNTKRLKAGDIPVSKTIEKKKFLIEALAPFTEKINNRWSFVYWENDSKTINGHSLVLKLSFGQRSILLGGDLNSDAENYLMTKYGNKNPFTVDVAKACHHGSSDFTEQYMQKVNPFATVISSGDNESYAHPSAAAIGCAGKYARGVRPLVYSTELARSFSKEGLLFGMINLRSNGTDIFMNQMKEAGRASDLWDAYQLPSGD